MSARDGGAELTAVRSVGGVLPADVLSRVVDPRGGLPGRSADDYQLELGVTPIEAANRAWSVLTGAWAGYRAALDRLPEGDRATSLTRDKWLLVLLRELGFGRVPTTPAGGIAAQERSFPVSHESRPVPIHLLGRDVPLDTKTPGLAGAADRAPHAMVQELLNRSHDHLWAIVANDNTLRLLRDSSTLVGQSYVEFDLAAIFDGELFADFTVLYLVCHHSRFQPTDEAGLAGCWLEQWRTDAAETGARALGALRDGVKDALEALGTGFLRHPANSDLRDQLAEGALDLADVHRSLLRLVYRLLFLFVAEDRGLLLDPAAEEAAKIRYREWFSTARLRHVARHRRGTRHDDQWQALRVVLDGLGQEAGRPELGLPALGGIFENGPVDVTITCALANEHLLAAIRHLSVIQPPGGGPRRVVDYRNLGAEELGGIYESLLEFVPRHDPNQRTFTLNTLAGNDRKTSGAYYTPTSLIDCLLDSALDPLLDQAEQDPDPEGALLALTVCDPACGSGHFLVAAAKRIAHRVARVRAEGAEPTFEQSQEAMHDVVARCMYGVDLNPMAAELAKVSLWLEALAAGRPLGFLDAHIKVGNALLGATPALLAAGIPDEAFATLEGDDKKAVASLKKQNKRERAGQGNLFADANIPVDNTTIADAARQIDALKGLSLADIHLARQRQSELNSSPELRQARLLADAWCAAFVAPKQVGEPAITHGTLEAWSRRVPPDRDAARLSVARLAAEYRFFHWHLEFPQVLATDLGADGPGWRGGFACVVGNPPWERVKLQEQEFFAALDPTIADAPNASARKKKIADLAETSPPLHALFLAAKRRSEGASHLVRSSGRFPLCGRGDINTYSIFAESMTSLMADGEARVGVILPLGIATDATTAEFFRKLIDNNLLSSLLGFENEARIFQGVHNQVKFCLLTLSAHRTSGDPSFAFFLRRPSDINEPGRLFTLSGDVIRQINPNTRTAPTLRRSRDADMLKSIVSRAPVLDADIGSGSGWNPRFSRMYEMAADSGMFRTADELTAMGFVREGAGWRADSGDRWVPLYEAKMLHAYNSRFGTYTGQTQAQQNKGVLPRLSESELQNPDLRPESHYWIPQTDLDARVPPTESWLLGWRRATRSVDERTLIPAILPRVGVGHSLQMLWVDAHPIDRLFLYANLASLACDYTARLKHAGSDFGYFIMRQVHVVSRYRISDSCPWDLSTDIRSFVAVRALELSYSGHDLKPLAVDLGDVGGPFMWSEDRRQRLRAELDAAFLHLYGIATLDDADYLLASFPIIHRKDNARYGEERTRRLVLESFGAMAEAARTGVRFISIVDPPPGQGPRHSPREGP